MPRKRTKAAKQAQALLVWLESLDLPARVINALRRDLEVITGEREGEEGSGMLAGLDQARFTEELYQKRGDQIGKVPTVAKSAIDALRAVITAPVTGDAIKATQPAEGDAAPVNPEVAQPAQDNEQLAHVAPEGVEEAQGDEPALKGAEVTQEAKSEVADISLADASDKQPADAAPAVPLALVDAPAAPKRRGRPPRAAAATAASIEPTVAPEAPANRRGRPPRDEPAAGPLPRTRRARVAAAITAAQPATAPVETFAPTPLAAPAALPVADPLFGVLLRLWRELHPQGQRAVMHYMAGLLAEV